VLINEENAALFREPKTGDAFGLLLEEADKQLRAGRSTWIPEIVEFSSGLLLCGDANYYLTSEPEWSSLERQVMRRVTGKVLDVGAGGGRHSIFLQENGFRVVALDSSPLAVSIAKRRGVREVICGSVRDRSSRRSLIALGKFDTVLMLGNNLGLLQSIENASSILDEIAEVVEIGGILMGTCGHPGVTVHEEVRIHHGVSGERIRIRYQDIASEWFNYLFTDSEAFKLIVEKSAHWQVEDVIEGSRAFAVVLRRK
jgi:SAM-dependent methyltransferase